MVSKISFVTEVKSLELLISQNVDIFIGFKSSGCARLDENRFEDWMITFGVCQKGWELG